MRVSSKEAAGKSATEEQEEHRKQKQQQRSSPPPPPLPLHLLPPNAPFPVSALADRDRGNAEMASGKASEAVIAYTSALLQLEKEEEESEGENEKNRLCRLARSLLLSNRAAARLSLRHFSKASADALESLKMCKGLWWRPWSRLARARAGAGDAAGAAGACRDGIEAVSSSPSSTTSLKANLFLLPTKERLAAQKALRAEADCIVMSFAKEGNYNGFDGAVLEVRPAESGSEWLGLPAPHDPQVDSDCDDGDEEDQSSVRRICSSNENKNALVLASSSSRPSKKSSFRSLHDALEAASDGDVIRLLPGTHNGLGKSVVIDKRVLIDGRRTTARAAATTTLDARGNVPALRFRRSAAVVGLTIDASGFREALRVDPLPGHAGGKEKVTRALLADCCVSCSGDDGVVVAGTPTISSSTACLSMIRCTITAKRAGVRAFLGGDVEMRECNIERCGTHGVAAQAVSASSSFLPTSSSLRSSSSRLVLGGKITAIRCRISRCLEEGALVSGPGSTLVLEGCGVSGCGGPAVDASGSRCLVVVRGGGGINSNPCRLSGECGGLWLWDGARARVIGSGGGGNDENNGNSNSNTTNGVSISSRSTFALLTDGPGTKLSVEGCDVRGGIRGGEAASALASRKNNSFCSSLNADEEVEDENSSPSRSSPLPPRHCGPPPAIGPFRWDGPDPLRVE